MDIEFVVPDSNDPKPKPKKAKEPEDRPEGVEGESIKTLVKNLEKLDSTPPPAITLDIEVPNPSKLREPTKDELHLASLDHDDPRVLLQQQFGSLPGVDPERAAAMANSMDGALHNMNVHARRELDLARRKAAREARGGGKLKGGRGKRKRRRR